MFKNKVFENRRGFFASLTTVPMIFIVSTVLLFPFVVIAQNITNNFFFQLILTIIAEIFTIFIQLFIGWGKNVQEWRNVIKLYKPEWDNVVKGLSVGLLLVVGLQIVSLIINNLGFSLSNSNTSSNLDKLPGWENVLGNYILAVIFIPFIEEILFRGIILNGFKQSFVKNKNIYLTVFSIIFSALLFALMHFQGFKTATDFFVLGWVFVVGLVNGVLFVKTKNIFTSYCCHFAYNGGLILLGFLMSIH